MTIEQKIKIYHIKRDNIWNHIIVMLKLDHKYVFSKACDSNLDLYFYYCDKIDDLTHQLHQIYIRDQ